jgi:hypothetical protein
MRAVKVRYGSLLMLSLKARLVMKIVLWIDPLKPARVGSGVLVVTELGSAAKGAHSLIRRGPCARKPAPR